METLDGVAEDIPLATGSVDAVVVGQAFHWFDVPACLDEIARVLRPGGGLAMLWNDEDERVPWVRRRRTTSCTPARCCRYDPAPDWSLVPPGDTRFTDVRVTKYEFVQAMTVDLLLERVASSSYIAAMAEAERG